MSILVVFWGFTVFFWLFFAPILGAGWLLGAEGDGLAYYLPAFLADPQLWSDLIFGGYPIAADPQNMTWYPPAMLLRLLPNAWNAFVVSGYVLAASFAYCYGFGVTGSRFAGACAGLVYSLCGFMIGHYSHVTMIHAAAWIPLIFAALERLRQQLDRRWWAIGIASVACCCLGGHPQISVYGLGLAVIYAIVAGWQAPLGRGRYYSTVLSMLVLGLGICAIQIFPTWELSRLTVRAEMSFATFTSFSLPVWQAIQMLFPFLFGGAQKLYGETYWGQPFWGEVVGCVGLLPLGLAAIAWRWCHGRRLVWFWAIAGGLAFLLTLGGDTPLGHWLYHVPVYQKFRAQGRHAVMVGLAASAFTALGIATIQTGQLSRRSLQRCLVGMAAVLLLAWLGLCWQQGFYQQLAQSVGVHLNLWPWQNPAIGVPFLTLGMGAIALLLWQRRRRAIWALGIVGGVLIWDLSSFAWFAGWHPPTIEASYVKENPAAQYFQPLLASSHQRLLSTKGSARIGADRLAPNLTRLWGLPNASGYTPLMLSRLSELLRLDGGGGATIVPTQPSDRSWDLMAVRYALVPPTLPLPATEGLLWWQDSLGLMAGRGACRGETPSSIRLHLTPTDLPVSQIGIVSQLGCAVDIANNAEVAKIKAIATDGTVVTGSLRAGRDTAEWAYDCPDVKPVIQHQRPPVFAQIPIDKPGVGRCSSNTYVSQIQLDQTKPLTHLEIQPVQDLRLGIDRLTLVHPQSQSSRIPTFWLGNDLSDTPRWQAVQLLNGTIVYENKLAMPRTWLVSELVQAAPTTMLQIIRGGALPDGRSFDPTQVALGETAPSQKFPDLQPTDIAKVVTIADTQVKIQTQTVASAVLVLSDVDYPGWQVTIDGKPATLLALNYVQRGVQVPPGSHLVQFAFRPDMFRIGAGVTLGTLCLAGLTFWRISSIRNSTT